MEETERRLYKPIKYITDVFIGEAGTPLLPGVQGKGQIAINDRPFILVGVRHQIVSDGMYPALPVQDGLYRIDWSLFETQRFFKGAIPMADAAHGSVRHGIWTDLDAPVTMPGNETLHVAVQNAFGPRSAPITVQLIFHGLERVDQ